MTDDHMRYNKKRVEHRQMDELIGLAQGMVADGRVNQAEAEYLLKWLVKNQDIHTNSVIEALYGQVDYMLSDNLLDEEESAELMHTLQALSGGDFEIGEVQKSTSLPFDDPEPQIIVPDRSFCFTGTFNYGIRKECRNAVTEKGGSIGNITKKLNYLVIGEYATQSWLHSSFGNKVIKAVGYRDDGTGLAIISEDHWAESMGL